jgi:hypothetical protein
VELTNQLAGTFKGGQAEIQNPGERYIYRGEIAAISVESGELKIQFAWLAKGEGGFPLPKRWVRDDRLAYVAGLIACSTSNIGPSGRDVGDGDRLCLNLCIIGEMLILYPLDGSKLDRSKVEGL